MSAYAVTMELAPGGDVTASPTFLSWQDYTDAVWFKDKITRTWGKRDRFPSGTPAGLSMTLLNTGGLFVPDNPMSPLYGLLDEGTPIRVMVAPRENSASDTFTRTSSSSWGTADTGGAWTNTGGAGSDFSVAAASGGRHLHTAVATNHYSTLAFSLTRIDITVRVRVNALSTGAAQSAGVVCRYTGPNDSGRAEIQFGTSGALTARIVQRVAGTDGVMGSAVVAGLTHSTSSWYRIRLQTGLSSARMKVWLDGTTEPRGWTIDGAASGGLSGLGAGAVGAYSRRETGNTNANATVDFDDFSLLDGPYTLQTCGVNEWPTEWSDASGKQSLARITAAGRLQWLQQADKALRSAIYRTLSRDSGTVQYWPMEDKSGAVAFASGLSGGPKGFFEGMSLGADSDVLGSEPLPTFSTSASRIWFNVPSYNFSGTWAVTWAMRIPASSLSGAAQVLSWTTPGQTVGRWQLTLTPGSPDTMQLSGFLTAGGTVNGSVVNFTDGVIGDELANGRQLYFRVVGTQNGGNVDTRWDCWFVASDGTGPWAFGSSASFAGTTGRVAYIYHDAITGFAGAGHTIGHVALGDGDPAFGASDAVAGYASESTKDRATRLCAEEKVPFWFGEILTGTVGATTQLMGPQGTTSLYDQLQLCESTETGILFDGRQGQITIMNRTGRYNHAVNLALDISQGHFGWPWKRTRDTQAMTTEVTVSSPTGSTVVATASSALVQRVGIKPQQVSVNAYRDQGLDQHAAWWLAQGVSRKGRYPQIPLQLHASPTLIRSYLEMDVGGRVQVVNLPGELPPDALELIAEGGTDLIDPIEWHVELNCSDGSQWLVQLLDSGNRLDCGASTTSSGFNTTATSVPLNIADRCTWTHASGDFDIFVAGERMRVTAVSAPVGGGSSWTQTLMVTRSINGVVKPHVAGEAVHVANPIILAL